MGSRHFSLSFPYLGGLDIQSFCDVALQFGQHRISVTCVHVAGPLVDFCRVRIITRRLRADAALFRSRIIASNHR